MSGQVSAGAARALAQRGPTVVLRFAPELGQASHGISAALARPKAFVEDPHATLRAHQQLVMDTLPEYEFDGFEADALAARLNLLVGAHDVFATQAPF